jgi:hypothetical protein
MSDAPPNQMFDGPRPSDRPPSPPEVRDAFLDCLGDLGVWLRGYWHAKRRKSKCTEKASVILGFIAAIGALISAYFFWGQWNVAEDTAQRQLRAYILYDPARIERSKDGRTYVVSVQAKNFGQSPAYGVTHWLKAEIRDKFPDPYNSFIRKEFRWTNTGGENVDLGSGQPMCIQITEPANVDDWTNPAKTLYIWCDVKYRDTFGRCQYDAIFLKDTEPLNKEARFANVIDWVKELPSLYDTEGCDESDKAIVPKQFFDEQPTPAPLNEINSMVYLGGCPSPKPN